MLSLFHSVLFLTAASVISFADSALNCMYCLSETWDKCDKDGTSFQCPAPIQSYCYSAIGRYDMDKDKGLVAVLRGCISDICTNKKKACDHLDDYVRQLGFNVNITACNVACCTGDNCNSNTRPELNSGRHDNVGRAFVVISFLFSVWLLGII